MEKRRGEKGDKGCRIQWSGAECYELQFSTAKYSGGRLYRSTTESNVMRNTSIPPLVIPCHIISYLVISYHIISRHRIIPYHVISEYTIPCYFITLCHVITICHLMPGHITTHPIPCMRSIPVPFRAPLHFMDLPFLALRHSSTHLSIRRQQVEPRGAVVTAVALVHIAVCVHHQGIA